MQNQSIQQYQSARQLWNSGQIAAAEAAYRQLIHSDPSFGYAYYDLAFLLDQQGNNPVETLKCYQRFVQLCGADPQVSAQVANAQGRIADLSARQAAPAATPTPAVAPAPVAAQSATPAPSPGKVTVSILGRGQFRSISEAIAAVPAGSQIVVKPGMYRENIVIDKPLEIIGDGPVDEIVIESADAHTITMQTNYAVVSGLTIEGCSSQHQAVITSQGQLNIEDCVITSRCTDVQGSIHVTGQGTRPVIRRCRIRDGSSQGISIFEGAEGLVEQCDIYQNGKNGILVGYGATPTIRQCKIFKNTYHGIGCGKNAQATVVENDLYENFSSGMRIQEESSGTFRKNRIFKNNVNGVSIYGNSQGLFEENEIYENESLGIEIKEESNPTIRQNRIYENGYSGISIDENGQGSIIENEIFDNATRGVVVKTGSSPTLKENKIYNTPSLWQKYKDAPIGIEENKWLKGIIVDADSQAIISGNELHHAHTGVHIDGGSAEIKGNYFHDTTTAGLAITEGGWGTIEENKFVSIREAAIAIGDGKYTEISQNVIHAVDIIGVSIRSSKVSFSNNRVSETLFGIGFFDGSIVSMDGDQILDGKGAGVKAGILQTPGNLPKLNTHQYKGNSLTMKNCSISSCSSGVLIVNNSRAEVIDCSIKYNEQAGISVRENSSATVRKCDLRDNGRNAIEVEKGSKVRERGNKK